MVALKDTHSRGDVAVRSQSYAVAFVVWCWLDLGVRRRALEEERRTAYCEIIVHSVEERVFGSSVRLAKIC